MLPSRSLVLAALLALAAAPGCKRPQEPSPAFEEAHARFLSLVESRGSRAYADPAMDGVLERLAQVPADSQDAEAARALRERIESERARLRQQEAEVAAALDFARAPAALPSSPEPRADEQAEAPAPEAAAPADAGYSQPRSGMPVGEFATRFSRCFAPGEPLYVHGKGQREAWDLKDLMVCRELHPEFVRQVVVIEDGKVLGFAERGPRVQLLPDGGVVPEAAR